MSRNPDMCRVYWQVQLHYASTVQKMLAHTELSTVDTPHFQSKGQHLKRVSRLCLENDSSRGRNLVLTVMYLPPLLDSGSIIRNLIRVSTGEAVRNQFQKLTVLVLIRQVSVKGRGLLVLNRQLLCNCQLLCDSQLLCWQARRLYQSIKADVEKLRRKWREEVTPSPESRNPKTETRNPIPETRSPEPETRDPRPGTRNPKAETRNPKPETRNPEPETRNPRPESQNPESEARDPKPKTRNLEPKT